MLGIKILFTCLIITGVTPYPYDQQQILNPPVFNFPQEYRHTEQRPVIHNKQFHFFTAPEETDSYEEVIPDNLLRKNVRVVVIKAPENKRITAAIARLAKTLAEEKTAIYVLNKEPDLKELTIQIDRLKQEKTQERPEVHFIKYKTSEEAELAAINIQSQYESLAGPSELNKAETAPLHSYVGSLNGEASYTNSESSVSISSTESLADGPLYISLPLIDGTTVDRRGEGKINPHVLPSSTGQIGDTLVVSTTISPPGEVKLAEVRGLYLPPDVIPPSSGKYLPPYNDLRVKKRNTKSMNEKVEQKIN